MIRPVWCILGGFDRAGMYLIGQTAGVFESPRSFENRGSADQARESGKYLRRFLR